MAAKEKAPAKRPSDWMDARSGMPSRRARTQTRPKDKMDRPQYTPTLTTSSLPFYVPFSAGLRKSHWTAAPMARKKPCCMAAMARPVTKNIM